MVLFLEYPKCGTCIKAKKWLKENNIEFEDRHILEENPTKEELKLWHKKSGLPLNKFFNTHGEVYRELNLKDKLSDMTEDEKFAILASNGKVVKRPLIVGEYFVLVGFNEEEWKKLI